MRIAIASDHAGLEQKQELTTYLRKKGFEVTDFGPQDDASVDYPDYAALVAKAVSSGETDQGVLVCGTGIGMAIAANKFAGIRAVNVITPQFAELSREHNNANVITLSGRFVPLDTNKEILDTFFATEFGGNRHTHRVEKITQLEKNLKN